MVGIALTTVLGVQGRLPEEFWPNWPNGFSDPEKDVGSWEGAAALACVWSLSPHFHCPSPHSLFSLVPSSPSLPFTLCLALWPFLSPSSPPRICAPAVPFQNLERSGNQHKAEIEAIMEQLKELKQKGEREKETLKAAIRAQKERAEKSEEYAEQLHAQLADKVAGRPWRRGRAAG